MKIKGFIFIGWLIEEKVIFPGLDAIFSTW